MPNNTNEILRPTLIVGLGGTGCRTLRRIKGFMQAQSPDLLIGPGNPQGLVKFLGIDLKEFSRASDAPLDKNSEFMEVGIGLNPDRRVEESWSSKENYGIKDHWPSDPRDSTGSDPYRTRHGRIVNGTGQIRLVGRVACFHAADKIYRRFSQIFENFFAAERDEAEIPEVYFISSMAGGTGSSMMFDVPYIAREAALAKVPNRKVLLYGHFILADAYLNLLANEAQRFQVQANCYTVLKEMDHHAMKQKWGIRYTNAMGTVDGSGELKESGEKPPYDQVCLYHSSNEKGFAVSGPDSLYEMIGQYISYRVLSGISSQFEEQDANRMSKGDINRKGKLMGYSAVGLSTLEFPKEQVLEVLKYRWAKHLANEKADHPDEKNLRWNETYPIFDHIFGKGFPVYIEKEGKREWRTDEDLRLDWDKLADQFKLPQPSHRHGNMEDRLIENYDDRRKLAHNLETQANEFLLEYGRNLREVESSAEGAEAIVGSLYGKIVGKAIIYGHSTDAISFACDSVLRKIREVREILAERRQYHFDINLGAEQRKDRAKLAESRMFWNRKDQVGEWCRALKAGTDAQAIVKRIESLQRCLDIVMNSLNVVRGHVVQADGKLENIGRLADQRERTAMHSAAAAQKSRVTTEYLVKASEFDEFLNDYDVSGYAEGVFSRLNNRLSEDCDSNLIALLNGTDEEAASVQDYFFEECEKAAAEALEDADFARVLQKIKAMGGEARLKGLLEKMEGKSSPWLTSIPEMHTGVDGLTLQDFILFPKSAQALATVYKGMEDAGGLPRKPSSDANARKVGEILGERVIRLSINHGYALESLTFMKNLHDIENEQTERERLSPAPRMFSIFKYHEEIPGIYDPPTPPREARDSALCYFAWAQALGKMRRQVSGDGSFWLYEFEEDKNDPYGAGPRSVRLPMSLEKAAALIHHGERVDIKADVDLALPTDLTELGVLAKKYLDDELERIPDEQDRKLVKNAVIGFCRSQQIPLR